VIISQDIRGTADNVQFTFGNADRAMTALSNDTDLKYASIDLCFYHVNTGILLQLWKGFVISFTTDGSPQCVVRRERRPIPDHAAIPGARGVSDVLEDVQQRRELPLRHAGQRRRSRVLRLLFRFRKRLQGARHEPVLRRASGRAAGRPDQGQLDRPVGIRAQQRHGHVDRFGHGVGAGASGKSGATTTATRTSPSSTNA